ncbi:vanadium-dependent haloperoxidase [Mycetocola sp. 2940]|uniref:vanadium-dependent haloperoxidase n=1 Tax=Mycetocola sp. 2940 TaxID=3156452 RepID=UPI00339448A0
MFRFTRALMLAIVATVGVITPSVAGTPAGAHPHDAADPAVITQWDAIANRTIFTENATPPPSSNLYFGYVSIAVYDAVVAIEGEYEPYNPQPRAHRHASPEVAAATAAYLVLKHHFPASADNLDADYQDYLSGVRNGVGRVQGIRVGTAAAVSLIQSRADDGLNAPIDFNVEPSPGIWRPTPDAFAKFAVPWLGFVRPFALASAQEFDLPEPPLLDSEAYAKDFNEVKDYGSITSTVRDERQTEIARFFSANPVPQYHAVLRDAVTRRGFDIVDSARAFALLGTSTADALITTWRAKFEVPTWRPITAIREADTDGNDATVADPGWTPMVQTPPYSDYASGHASVTGSTSNVFGYLFGENTLDIDIPALVAGTTTRHYDSTDAWDQDAMDARVWLGLHVRFSMGFANETAHKVSDHVISTLFQPVN